MAKPGLRGGPKIGAPRRTAECGALTASRDCAVGDEAAIKNTLRLSVTAQLGRRVLRVRMLGSAAIDPSLARGERRHAAELTAITTVLWRERHEGLLLIT